MQHDFWHERWQQNQIGFHNQETNPNIKKYWPELNLKPGSRVLVPLCGKSLDMLWLQSQGFEVLGVELSSLAVDAFFTENQLSARQRQQGAFIVYECHGLSVLCGDFFALTASDLHEVDAVFDRAALVALPAEMRAAYVVKLQQLLAAGSQSLLVAFDYEQQAMSGPPFSVPFAEIKSLFGPYCDITLLSSQDILDSEPHFRDKGLSRMQEQVYRLISR
jgi:thiopurine S-methyltransferase